jgi:hypothetical protein
MNVFFEGGRGNGGTLTPPPFLGGNVANQLATNPWVLDTPGLGVLYQTDVKSAHFEWEGYANQADVVEVQDRFGKVIWRATGQNDLSLVESFTIEWVHGINLTVLAAGSRLRVYFK